MTDPKEDDKSVLTAGNALRQREASPAEWEAIEMLWKAHKILRREGWADPRYAPKDGLFEVIELGSTGIHIATHFENDHKFQAWILDGDAWPSRPLLIRRGDADLKRRMR